MVAAEEVVDSCHVAGRAVLVGQYFFLVVLVAVAGEVLVVVAEEALVDLAGVVAVAVAPGVVGRIILSYSHIYSIITKNHLTRDGFFI